MRIASVRIENFRSFKDETVPFNNYACLVGPNGAGKSTVLTALNVFFRESDNLPTDLTQLEQEDFHCKNTGDPIRITVSFTDLSEDAQTDFSDYVRQGQLVVTAIAIFVESTGKAQVIQYGQRLGMMEFKSFFDAVKNQSAAVLKGIYNGFRETHTDLPLPGTKATMDEALRDYEAARPNECELIPSKEHFYGNSKEKDLLTKHIHWVYVPAVKDATTEQVGARNSALGKLLERTVQSKTNFDMAINKLRIQTQEQYQELLEDNQNALDDISSALQQRISEWAHPEARLRLQWKQDPDKSVRVEVPWAHILAGEGEFEGELARFGHGLQRSYLLALLQELAKTEDDTEPTLILACEEPELYQHPPQVRYLAAILNTLSKSNAQVIVSTHDPRFVSGQGIEDVRMIRKDTNNRHSVVSHLSFDKIAKAIAEATGKLPAKPEGTLAKIHQALQPSLNEMFFTRRLVLVEGLEDVAYLLSYLILLDKTDEFRRLGCHIVAVNGKSELLQPLVLARHMRIPTYVIFDADADKRDKNGSQAKHIKDNCALLKLLGRERENPMPTTTYSCLGFTMWHSNIGAIVEADIGKNDWELYSTKADNCYGNAGGLSKNSLHIGASLTFAWKDGKKSASLAQVCNAILEPDNYVF